MDDKTPDDPKVISLQDKFRKSFSEKNGLETPVVKENQTLERTRDRNYHVVTKSNVHYHIPGYVYPLHLFVAICEGDGIVKLMLPNDDIALIEEIRERK